MNAGSRIDCPVAAALSITPLRVAEIGGLAMIQGDHVSGTGDEATGDRVWPIDQGFGKHGHAFVDLSQDPGIILRNT